MTQLRRDSIAMLMVLTLPLYGPALVDWIVR